MPHPLPLTQSTDAAFTDGALNRLDRRALDDIRMLQTPGHENVVAKMIRIYLTRTEELLGQMRQAAAVKDAKAFHRAAHSLASNSRVIGAVRVARLAKQMESSSRSGPLEGSEAQIAELAHEFDLVRAMLLETLRAEDCGRGLGLKIN